MSETQQMLSFLDKLDDSIQTIKKYIDNPQTFILTLILPFPKKKKQELNKKTLLLCITNKWQKWMRSSPFVCL